MGIVERILKLRALTDVNTPEELEADIFKPWRDSYKVLEANQPEVNDKYGKFLLKHANERFFKLSQLEMLGYDPDIYLILTKRNCGKTYSYMELCSKIIEKGEEFVIVRNSQRELNNAVKQQFRDYAHFFRYEMVCKNDCVYEKIPYEEEYKGKSYTKYEYRRVGYLAYLSGTTQSFQGSSYPKAKTIIWDEATNAGKTSNQTEDGINAFWQLVITFFRGKQGCKMYIFGNLMNSRDKDGNTIVSDSLIKGLGITPEDNMKYITRTSTDRHGDVKSISLLYLNTRDLYNTAIDQLTAIFVDAGKSKALRENRPVTSGSNVVGEIDFIRCHEKMMGVHGTYGKQNFIIQIGGDPDIPLDEQHIKAWEDGQLSAATGRFYIIRVTQLNRYTLGFNMPIYTDNPVVYSTHRDILTFTNMMPKVWYSIDRILKGAKCLYVGDSSYANLCDLMSAHKHYVKEYEMEGELKKGGGKKRKRGV